MKNKNFWINTTFILLTLVLIIGMANTFRTFYRGYHNVDLTYNFNKIGFSLDLASDFKYHSLDEIYIIGLNDMKKAMNLSALFFCIGILWAILFMAKFYFGCNKKNE